MTVKPVGYQNKDTGLEHNKLYKTKRWGRTKDLVIIRDEGICQECHKMITGRFIIHHKQVATLENFYNIDNLELVCQTCHNRLTFSEGLRREYKPVPKKKINNDLINY